MRSDKKLKRAVSDEFVIMIIFMIVLSTMLFFFSHFRQNMENTTPKQICKSSVRLHSGAHIADLYLKKGFKCPTQYVAIESTAKEEIMAELADKMYDCWDMFWQGDLNLFEQRSGRTINYCVICHHIVFKNQMKISTQEFRSFLASTDVPGQEITYENYLSSSTSDPDFDNAEIGDYDNLDAYEIDTSIPYVTMFSYNKKGYWHKLSTTPIGFMGGAALGFVLAPFTGGGSLVVAGVVLGAATTGTIIGYTVGSKKASDWQSNIQLMPYELSQIKEIGCNYLPVGD